MGHSTAGWKPGDAGWAPRSSGSQYPSHPGAGYEGLCRNPLPPLGTPGSPPTPGSSVAAPLRPRPRRGSPRLRTGIRLRRNRSAILSCQVRSESLLERSYPSPRRPRCLKEGSLVLLRSLLNRPPGVTVRPAPRLHVRKRRRNDFRHGLVLREGRPAAKRGALPLVLKPQVPSVRQPKERNLARLPPKETRRGSFPPPGWCLRPSFPRRDVLLSPVPMLAGPLPRLCPLPSLPFRLARSTPCLPELSADLSTPKGCELQG